MVLTPRSMVPVAKLHPLSSILCGGIFSVGAGLMQPWHLSGKLLSIGHSYRETSACQTPPHCQNQSDLPICSKRPVPTIRNAPGDFLDPGANTGTSIRVRKETDHGNERKQCHQARCPLLSEYQHMFTCLPLTRSEDEFGRRCRNCRTRAHRRFST